MTWRHDQQLPTLIRLQRVSVLRLQVELQEARACALAAEVKVRAKERAEAERAVREAQEHFRQADIAFGNTQNARHNASRHAADLRRELDRLLAERPRGVVVRSVWQGTTAEDFEG